MTRGYRIAVLGGLLAAALVWMHGCGQGEMELESPVYEPPESVELDAGEAAWVVVDLRPTRHIHNVGTAITPSARVFEPDWTELDDVRVEWIVTPAQAVDGEGDQWRIEREGEITFRACVLDGNAPTSICEEQSIEATDDQRALVLESPAPGEHFSGAVRDTIPVRGTVDGALSLNAVRVNDRLVSVDQQGRFTYQLEPHFGVNTIEVRPPDAHTSEADTAVVSAMWAPDYRELNTDDGLEANFDNALFMGLGQEFLDDGRSYQQTAEGGVETRDIADLLVLILEHLEPTPFVPNPVVDTDTATLKVSDIDLHNPRIDVLAVDDGLELFGTIGDVSVATDGFVQIADQTVGLDGNISVSLSVFATLHAEKPDPQLSFDVDLTDFDMAIEEVDAEFESVEAVALFEVADSFLRDALEQLVVDTVQESFVDELPQIVSGLLDSADEQLTGHERVIDPGFITALTVGFDGGIGEFDADYGVGLASEVTASLRVLNRAARHPDFSGIPSLEPEIDSPSLMAQSRFQLGINYGLLNAVPYLLWQAGIFNIDITDVLPDSVDGVIESGEVEFALPPVIRPPVDDETDDLVIHIGQMEVEVQLLEQTLRFGFEMIAGAGFEIVDREARLDIGDNPRVNVWLIEASEDDPLLEADEVRDTIENIVWPEIRAAIGEAVGSFSLPVPTLAILEEFVPDLADMEFAIGLERPPHERDGFLMVEPSVDGEWQSQ